MTVFDKIVKGGPSCLAMVIAELTCQTVEKLCSRSFGLDIDIPDAIRNEVREDFYNSLLKED